MKKASAAAVQARFSAFLNESQKGPVVVMANGKPIAVLMDLAASRAALRSPTSEIGMASCTSVPPVMFLFATSSP